MHRHKGVVKVLVMTSLKNSSLNESLAIFGSTLRAIFFFLKSVLTNQVTYCFCVLAVQVALGNEYLLEHILKYVPPEQHVPLTLVSKSFMKASYRCVKHLSVNSTELHTSPTYILSCMTQLKEVTIRCENDKVAIFAVNVFCYKMNFKQLRKLCLTNCDFQGKFRELVQILSDSSLCYFHADFCSRVVIGDIMFGVDTIKTLKVFQVTPELGCYMEKKHLAYIVNSFVGKINFGWDVLDSLPTDLLPHSRQLYCNALL